jgi:syntaxin 6
MLDEVESGVDGADRKLREAMGRMRKFIRETEEKRGGWCVLILIIILIALLLLVVLL